MPFKSGVEAGPQWQAHPHQPDSCCAVIGLVPYRPVSPGTPCLASIVCSGLSGLSQEGVEEPAGFLHQDSGVSWNRQCLGGGGREPMLAGAETLAHPPAMITTLGAVCAGQRGPL